MDVKKELIELDRTEVEVSADSLPQFVPEDSPRYHFYRFKHTHEGDYQEVIGEPLVDSILITYFKSYNNIIMLSLQCSFIPALVSSRPLRKECSTRLARSHSLRA